MNLVGGGILLSVVDKIIVHASVVDFGPLPLQVDFHRLVAGGVGDVWRRGLVY